MKIKRIQDPAGVWIDCDSLRYSLIVVRRQRDACGVNVGFEDFPTLDAALTAWGLRLDSLTQKDDDTE